MAQPARLILPTALLACLIVAPLADAVAVEVSVPGPVPTDGTPFDVHVTVEEAGQRPLEVKTWLGGESWQASRTWNGSALERSDRYVLEVEPTEGRWSGWVTLAANPASRNHGPLTENATATVGVRVRGPVGRAATTASAELMHAPEHRLVSVPNGTPVTAFDPAPIAHRTPTPPGARLVEVAVPPGFDGTLCHKAPCPSDGGLVLDRVGPDLARVRNAGPSAVDLRTAVVVLEAARCALTGHLDAGATVTLTVGDTTQGGQASRVDGGDGGVACTHGQPTGGARVGELWHTGRVIDQAPDPPGWGDAVREAWGEHAWSPWRLPRGVEPAPVRFERVEGAITAFDTREEGLTRVLEVIEGARERLTVATYLFTNERVADALVAAERRGVDVELLLEPTPVGGLPTSEQRIVRWLEAAGVEVAWFGGPIHEHGLQHAKVIVADGAVVLVLTENLTHSGLPADGDGNLGLGLGVANTTLARRLEAIVGGEGPSRPWMPASYRAFEGEIAVLTSPENIWRIDAVPAWIATTGRVDALALRVSPDWGARPNAWLDALAEHSREHPVRLIASGVPDGARAANRLGLAALTGDPSSGDVRARVSDPSLGTVHAKAMLGTDGVLVGSTNWGMGGVLLNREVNLLVHDPETADNLGAVFDDAWNGTERDRTPVPGLSASLVGALALGAGWIGHRALPLGAARVERKKEGEGRAGWAGLQARVGDGP